jgi:hypothetical protein
MLKIVSFHIQTHRNAFLQILEYYFQSVGDDSLNATLRWCTSFIKSIRNAVWHAWNEPLAVFTKEKHALFDCIYFTHAAFDNWWDAGMRNTGKCKSLDGSNISREWGGGSPCCFPSLAVCVYKLTHYLNNIIFIDNNLRPLARESPSTVHVLFNLCNEIISWYQIQNQFAPM